VGSSNEYRVYALGSASWHRASSGRVYLRDASPAAGLGVRRALLVERGDRSILPLTLSSRVHRRDIDLLDHAH